MDTVVTSVQPETPAAEGKTEQGLGDQIKEQILHTPLYEMFKAEKNPRTEEIFTKIWKWATDQAEVKDVDSIKWEVVKLKNRVGSPQIGEPSWAKVERWVSAYYDLKKSEERMKEMESNGR